MEIVYQASTAKIVPKARHCEICDSRLSTYNSKTICHACSQTHSKVYGEWRRVDGKIGKPMRTKARRLWINPGSRHK